MLKARTTASSSIMAGDAARQEEIDARITSLECDIIRLKEERNASSPTAHLPPEILSRIFIIFADMFPAPGTSQLHYWYQTMEWTVIIEVSRRWRQVALSCARLWSRLAFYTLGWAAMMLERSKQSPLHIE